jgi:hypothetical protein
MKTRIGTYDPETRTVAVTFVDGGVTHKRPVNAVLDEAGAYDRKATKARVDEVALGVAHKIQIGAIVG